jgi:hypothetical protein
MSKPSKLTHQEERKIESDATGQERIRLTQGKIDPTKLTNPHVICANGNIYTLLGCLGAGQFG